MNAILLQQAFDGVFPPGDFRPLMELTKERNEEYCKRWNFDYWYLIGVPSEKFSDVYLGQWCKVEMIRQSLAKGYDYVVWLDADAMIKDVDTDLRDACYPEIGVCWHRIPQLRHWNTGVMYFRNTQETKNFIDEWLKGFPGLGDGWNEQGVFNKMAMQSKLVQTISDRWNATVNVSMVPDAVVLGFHGFGDAAQRLAGMKAALK